MHDPRSPMPHFGQPAPPGRMRWIAVPPDTGSGGGNGYPPHTGTGPGAGGTAGRGRYLGPPSYPAPPRWGFPHVAWRWPTSVPGTVSATLLPSERLLLIARNAVAALWALVVLATVAAGAEIWRYVLLVQSRNSALSPAVVGFSDVLVLMGALLTFVATVFAFAVTLWWLLVARTAAADEAGQRPPRPGWQVVLGILVPGVNLAFAGSVLAELEHAATRQPANRRPRPSRLISFWWSLWGVNAVFWTLTVVWRLRDGVQAQADAVLLTACTDVSAVLLALVTARIVRRFTRLLAPMDEAVTNRFRVVRVEGAPELPRRAKPATATR